MTRSEPWAAVTGESPMGEVVSGLRGGLGGDLVAAVLFGSRARGKAGEGSDWDLLVVARGLPEGTLERYALLKKMLPAYRGEVSLLAKTPEEFMSSLPDLYLDIAFDGVILYDPDGYMVEKLRLLRELARRKGLRREVRGRDRIWRRTREPRAGWSLDWEELS